MYIDGLCADRTKIIQGVFSRCLRDTPSKIIATVIERYSSDSVIFTIYDLTRSGFRAIFNTTNGLGWASHLEWRTFYGKFHFAFY